MLLSKLRTFRRYLKHMPDNVENYQKEFIELSIHIPADYDDYKRDVRAALEYDYVSNILLLRLDFLIDVIEKRETAPRRLLASLDEFLGELVLTKQTHIHRARWLELLHTYKVLNSLYNTAKVTEELELDSPSPMLYIYFNRLMAEIEYKLTKK